MTSASERPAISVRLFRIIVPVTDIQQAHRFYSGILGISGSLVSPGRRYFNCGDVILACYDAQADGDDKRPLPLSEPLYFSVPDLDEAYQRCLQHGALFSDEAPADVGPLGQIAWRPWGEQSFYVSDPFGNALCFVSRETALTGA